MDGRIFVFTDGLNMTAVLVLIIIYFFSRIRG